MNRLGALVSFAIGLWTLITAALVVAVLLGVLAGFAALGFRLVVGP